MELATYAQRWLETLRPPVVRPKTWTAYEWAIRCHLAPAFGALELRAVTKGAVRALLTAMLTAGRARDTVRMVHATLRALLTAAVDDALVESNIALGLGRRLRLVANPQERQQRIRAMNRTQLAAFLEAARAATNAAARRCWPLFFLLARTGLTVGEAFALEWTDCELGARAIVVERAVVAGVPGPPKRCRSRRVDMSRELAAILRHLVAERRLEARARRWPALPPWVFCTAAGTRVDYARVRRAFHAACERAGLAGFSPHSLRHSFASLLLQQGESPAYVQRQLGHTSIKTTVDTYGRWLPMSNLAAVDRLDARER